MDLDLVQQELGLNFRQLDYLKRALTHSSFTKISKNRGLKNNERLEFLGDAVLKLLSSDYLFEKFPDSSEGDMTKIRANLISDKVFYSFGKQLNLGKYLVFSFGEKNSGGSNKESNLANAFEALVGAIYLDRGLEESRRFFLDVLKRSSISFESMQETHDYKSLIQEELQKRRESLPVYTVLNESGPEHSKVFNMEIKIVLKGELFLAKGTGRTKKEAEQSAAKEVYSKLSIG
ncbi:ribonuclease III [bacterium]|jgi:ribonuclease III|nr:ribonuclease III [bacterium]